MCPAIFSIIESSDNVHKADIPRPEYDAAAGGWEPLKSESNVLDCCEFLERATLRYHL